MRTLVVFAFGLTATLSFGWLAFPRLLYKAEPQPLQFNHKVHIDKGGMECAGCHEITSTGQFAGIPKVENCATCHAEALGTTKAEAELVSNYVTPGREIPWKVYSRQPINVRFSHSVHSQQAKLKCEQCHGPRGDTTSAEPFYSNRITGESRNIWGPRMIRTGLKPGDAMKMSDCESCHAERGVAAGCLGCHR